MDLQWIGSSAFNSVPTSVTGVAAISVPLSTWIVGIMEPHVVYVSPLTARVASKNNSRRGIQTSTRLVIIRGPLFDLVWTDMSSKSLADAL